MRKLLAFFVVLLSVSGCQHQNNPLVAEAFHHKLYLSDVLEHIPYFTSKEDSILFIEQYVNAWVLNKTILAMAKQELTKKEQNFASQVALFNEKLLINTYLTKVSSDSLQFVVSSTELSDFMNETKFDKAPEYRDMVKFNYIKLSNPSKVYTQAKRLLFEEKDRVKAIRQLETLCADTIEYYLDSEYWFYTDFLENDLPIKFSQITTQNEFDIVQNEYRYLILLLDRKQQFQPRNTLEDRKMAQVLLQQQKKAEFIVHFQDSLVEKAIQKKRVVRYPVGL